MRRRRIELLHTHLLGSNAWGPLLRRAGGASALVSHEHSPFRRGDVDRWDVRGAINPWIVGPTTDRLLVPSRWSRDGVVCGDRVPAAKVRIVPNGAPTIEARPDREAIRAALGVRPDDVAIVISAMLRPEKGHVTALRALAAALPRCPRLRLLVVGGGPPQRPTGTLPQLVELAGALGVAERTTFLGRREDVPQILAAADVGLLPSDHENLPLALLEYMAAGLPVVATAVGGVPDAVDDGVHALLVPPGEPQALAAALLATVEDPAAAARRGDAARARHAARYTWDAVASAVERVYLELLDGPPS